MAQVVVIGAGVAGLGSALVLGRAGHRVTLLERDATPLPADPDAAFAWDRRGAPQVRHSHALLARLHNLLRDRYPDVLDALLAAGASEIRFCDMPPAELVPLAPEPGDDDLVAIACRRTTFEWVLRRTVLAEPDVTLLDGVAVEGLVTPAGGDGPPVVTGVRVREVATGAERVLDADVVIDATGRRTGGPSWLTALGVEPEVVTEDTGIVYLSRFYRLHDDIDPPRQEGPIGGDLGYLKYAIFQGDNRTHSVTFAVATHDDDLRRRLLDPDTFDRAALALPATRAWVETATAAAITPVHVMAGLLNRRVHHTTADGDPLVLGYLAVGDAHTCTNPLYGRGCTLAMVQATLLGDAIDHVATSAGAGGALDLAALARTYEEASEREVVPWYKAAVAQDRLSREAGDDATGEPAGKDDEGFVDPRQYLRDVMREGLLPAVRTDPVVFRAFLRGFNLLEAPDALMADADVASRVFAVYADRENRPPEPVLGPPRAGLLDALAS